MRVEIKKVLTIVCIAIVSCNTEVQQERVDLLTLISWTTEQNTSTKQTSKFSEGHCTFHKNGNYSFDSGNLKLMGRWGWMANNEIYLEWESIIVNDIQTKFEKKPKYHIRILEISETDLKTLVKSENDTWESGAKKLDFKPISK